jgi:hypothetical protein
VLLRRPFPELGGYLIALAAVTFGILAYDGLDRADLAGFITVLAGSAGIQFAVVIAARALEMTARQAASAAESEIAVHEHELIAERVHAARQARWLALRETAEPLLRELGTGSADPGVGDVRVRCTIEASRLRRLLAEGDGSPSPLIHELYACADIAERRGLIVDIEVAGVVPAVPIGVRRSITDVVIPVLAAARGHARITAAAVGRGVAVSVVADVPSPRLPAPSGRVIIEQQRDQDDLWVEVRWTGP